MFDWLKRYEQFMIQALMLMMALVLGLATIDLGWFIIQDIIDPPYFVLSIEELLDIFGLFMLVVIGIELLETIMKSYISHGQPHYEVVISVAIIAISRKVIILDLKEVDGVRLIGIAAIIVALTVGYYLMRRGEACRRPD